MYISAQVLCMCSQLDLPGVICLAPEQSHARPVPAGRTLKRHHPFFGTHPQEWKSLQVTAPFRMCSHHHLPGPKPVPCSEPVGMQCFVKHHLYVQPPSSAWSWSCAMLRACGSAAGYQAHLHVQPPSSTKSRSCALLRAHGNLMLCQVLLACAATIIYLVPELCRVHPLRVPVLELARRALSGLLYRLRNLLLAEELRGSFHEAVKDLPACAVGQAHE